VTTITFADLDPGDLALVKTRSAGTQGPGSPAMLQLILVLRPLTDAELAIEAARGGMGDLTGPAVWALSVGGGDVAAGLPGTNGVFAASAHTYDVAGMTLLARYRPDRGHATVEESAISALLPEETS
jgi:hypothetical protein